MKTILITGGAKGIGAAIAAAAAKSGYNVIINYLTSEDKAVKLCAELNKITACIAIKADISDLNQTADMYKTAIKRFGKIDVLVNNAAISSIKLFNDITPLEWQKIFDVNVNGVYNCVRQVLPEMISNKSGKIINIASMWGEVGASCEAHYSATKAAVIGFTKALAKEVAPSGITVNCVSPGCILTDMNSGHSKETLKEIAEETPLGRLGAPEEIADAVMFLASEKADFITGQILSINGGLVI